MKQRSQEMENKCSSISLFSVVFLWSTGIGKNVDYWLIGVVVSNGIVLWAQKMQAVILTVVFKDQEFLLSCVSKLNNVGKDEKQFINDFGCSTTQMKLNYNLLHVFLCFYVLCFYVVVGWFASFYCSQHSTAAEKYTQRQSAQVWS